MYGITETTVHVTYRPITRGRRGARRGSVIGRPIPDLRVYVLDARRQPVPIGVPGEITSAAPASRAATSNRPELTAERFVARPVRDAAGGAPVPHRRSRAAASPTATSSTWAASTTGEDPRLPDRAGRDRGGARGSTRRCARRSSSRARTRRATSGSSPTCVAARRPRGLEELRAHFRAEAAGVHGAGASCRSTRCR